MLKNVALAKDVDAMPEKLFFYGLRDESLS
jgi:hypothetical protein